MQLRLKEANTVMDTSTASIYTANQQTRHIDPMLV